MLGSRSVPPATSLAAGPSPATTASASSSDLGWRNEIGGSLSIARRSVLLALGAFEPGRQRLFLPQRFFASRHRSRRAHARAQLVLPVVDRPSVAALGRRRHDQRLAGIDG